MQGAAGQLLHSARLAALTADLAREIRKTDIKEHSSKLNGLVQRSADASRYRLCIPASILRASPDILGSLAEVSKLTNRSRSAAVPFEIVIYGAGKYDMPFIDKLNKKAVRQALDIADNVIITTISESEISDKAWLHGWKASSLRN